VFIIYTICGFHFTSISLAIPSDPAEMPLFLDSIHTFTYNNKLVKSSGQIDWEPFLLTENDVIEFIREFLERQFPKECPNCQRGYDSLADYLHNVTHIGDPISHDADMEDWRPREPLGTIAMSNCACGNTLSLASRGMNVIMM
jgi:hypothetical protein